MDYWHAKILTEQGFSKDDQISQYELLGKLGEGAFGAVFLAHHKFSAVKVAIKFMDKAVIASSFTANGESFQERDIMRICSQSKIPNVLELVEDFENEQQIVMVTKFMPAGDMLNYLIKQPT